MRVLLVAEGSGGHLIPALEVAEALAHSGAQIKVWYAQRQHTAPLTQRLTQARASSAVDIDPIPLPSSTHFVKRLWHCGQLWHRAQRCFDAFAPDVVVGFGGWVSAPVMLAARRRRIRCVLHEQNAVMGRTNRWLARWADRVAVSFQQTGVGHEAFPWLVTGMPVREEIGRYPRVDAAARFGFAPDRPTLLVLGGSQGSRAINRIMVAAVARCSAQERERWQVLHLIGADARAPIAQAYADAGLTARVEPFLADMAAAYAAADLVIARAGASTIAELARCGTPAILVPYPYARAHQRVNARLVETIGGGLCLEESQASPERLLAAMRRLLNDQRLRAMMGAQLQALHCADAAQRLADAITDVAHGAHVNGARHG